MKTVTIHFTYGDNKDLVSRHRTNDDQEATERAIKKHFGSRASFFKDNGISTATTTYGQIGHYVELAGCYSMDTGRVWIEIA